MRAGMIVIGAALCAAALLHGCQQQHFDLDAETIQKYRARMAQSLDGAPVPRPLVRPAATTQPASTQPDDASLLVPRQAARTVPMSLQNAMVRAMTGSLDIKVESYTPDITQQDLLAAEAAFDAVFFADFNYSRLDEPTNSTFFGGGRTDNRNLGVGFRKPLSTGGQVTATYTIDRTWSNQPFQRFNPHYDNDLTLELTQPLLKNFGIDVNRAQIYIARNNRDISLFQFRRRVIDTLAAVEIAYWDLYFARQSQAIQADLVRQAEETRDKIKERLLFDATPGQVSQAKAVVASEQASYIRLSAGVRDAEDNLKNLLNDPALPIGEDIAIVPTDEPITDLLPLDAQREMWAALENRGELQEARLNIANANINRGLNRNQLLPKLDLYFRWNVNGLRDSFRHTNSQLLATDFQDYVVGFSFEFPIGNRAAEAGVRKSQLQLEQAVVNYHNLAGDVMTQVQIALRNVHTSYQEIVRFREAAHEEIANLKELVAREERMNPTYLDLILRTVQAVAQFRRSFQSAIVNYNKAVVELEQAKGTLLRYDRVQLAPEGR